jgi:hypothetical protein
VFLFLPEANVSSAFKKMIIFTGLGAKGVVRRTKVFIK